MHILIIADSSVIDEYLIEMKKSSTGWSSKPKI